MKKMCFGMVVAVGLWLGPVAVAAQQRPPEPTILMKVEPGDTLLSLFGTDWPRAWNGNELYVRRGNELVSSPDILIAGAVLRVPRNIGMTPKARRRLEDAEARDAHDREVDALRAVAEPSTMDRTASEIAHVQSRWMPLVWPMAAVLSAMMLVVMLRRPRSDAAAAHRRYDQAADAADRALRGV